MANRETGPNPDSAADFVASSPSIESQEDAGSRERLDEEIRTRLYTFLKAFGLEDVGDNLRTRPHKHGKELLRVVNSSHRGATFGQVSRTITDSEGSTTDSSFLIDVVERGDIIETSASYHLGNEIKTGKEALALIDEAIATENLLPRQPAAPEA